MNFYGISGLTISSEIRLPGLAESAAVAAPDVTVRFGKVPISLPNPARQGRRWQIAGEQFLLHVLGVAGFLLTDGQEIVCEPVSGVGPEEAAAYITGTVFGILLHQRGNIIIHASTVELAGRAVLFCGESGAGKSTLAAALARRGHPVASDDFCVIDTSSGEPVVLSDGRLLKLWLPAIEHLELADNQGQAVPSMKEKFYVSPAATARHPLPLGAVYELCRAVNDSDISIECPSALDVVLLLRRNAYRPPLVAAMQQQSHYFRAAALIANKANVFRLHRPFDLARLSTVADYVESHSTARRV